MTTALRSGETLRNFVPTLFIKISRQSAYSDIDQTLGPRKRVFASETVHTVSSRLCSSIHPIFRDFSALMKLPQKIFLFKCPIPPRSISVTILRSNYIKAIKM